MAEWRRKRPEPSSDRSVKPLIFVLVSNVCIRQPAIACGLKWNITKYSVDWLRSGRGHIHIHDASMWLAYSSCSVCNPADLQKWIEFLHCGSEPLELWSHNKKCSHALFIRNVSSCHYLVIGAHSLYYLLASYVLFLMLFSPSSDCLGGSLLSPEEYCSQRLKGEYTTVI